MIFSLIFVFKTLKKSVLCQGKVPVMGTAAKVQGGCASRIALLRSSYLELVEISTTGLVSRSAFTCCAWQLR